MSLPLLLTTVVMATLSAVTGSSEPPPLNIIRYEATVPGGRDDADVDLKRVIVEETTGTVFVASQRAIYRLNEFLTLQSYRDTTALVDDRELNETGLCPSSWMADDLRLQQMEHDPQTPVTVLELDRTSKSLLYCGSSHCGLCSLVVDATESDLTTSAFRPFDPAELTSYVGSTSDPCAIFVNVADSSPSTGDLITANALSAPTAPAGYLSIMARATDFNYDVNESSVTSASAAREVFSSSPVSSVLFMAGALTSRGREILSVRIVQESASTTTTGQTNSPPRMRYRYWNSVRNFNFSTPFSFGTTTSTSSSNLRRRTPIDLFKRLLAFEDDGFIYFLMVIRKPQSGESFPTRLARICANDTQLESYVELKMKCEWNNGEYGVAATVAEDGDKPGKALYVIMEYRKQPADGQSALCKYDLKSFHGEIKRSQMDCERGTGTVLEWIHGAQYPGPPCKNNVSIVNSTSSTSSSSYNCLYCQTIVVHCLH